MEHQNQAVTWQSRSTVLYKYRDRSVVARKRSQQDARNPDNFSKTNPLDIIFSSDIFSCRDINSDYLPMSYLPYKYLLKGIYWKKVES